MKNIIIPFPDNPEHVDNLKTISLLKAQGFQGQDVDLAISLFEYNFIWRELDTEYLIVHAQPVSFNRYSRTTISKSLDVKEEYNWILFDDIYEFTGLTAEQWDELPLPQKLMDLVSYHGVINVFGENDCSFSISD